VLALTESADIRRVPSYPLACNGGGNMKVSVLSRGHQGRTTFVVEFVRAPQGANARAPGPGECAWLDRAVAPEEPNRLYMSMRGVLVDITLDGQQRLVNWSAGNLPLSSGVSVTESSSIAVSASVADRLLDDVLRGRPFGLRAFARTLGARADFSGPVLIAWYE
jgi:hypothetical protein